MVINAQRRPNVGPILRPIGTATTTDHQTLLRLHISGWLRQNRHRLQKSNVPVEISFADIMEIYELFGYKCVYCGGVADSPDHPFPLKIGGPCVPANVLPCCNSCRAKKRGNDIVQFYRDGYIPKEQLQSIIKSMFKRRGGEQVRDHIKAMYPK